MDADTSDLTAAQLPGLIKEWRTLEEDMHTLSAEIREKRKRVKLVRGLITNIMKANKVGRINISSGSVTSRTTTTKAPLTKKYLLATLTDFFNGDAVTARKCADFLDEHRPLKNNDKLELDPIATPATGGAGGSTR
jgi:hypothetical protein